MLFWSLCSRHRINPINHNGTHRQTSHINLASSIHSRAILSYNLWKTLQLPRHPDMSELHLMTLSHNNYNPSYAPTYKRECPTFVGQDQPLAKSLILLHQFWSNTRQHSYHFQSLQMVHFSIYFTHQLVCLGILHSIYALVHILYLPSCAPKMPTATVYPWMWIQCLCHLHSTCCTHNRII